MLASSFLLYCFCKCYTFKHLVKPDTFVSIEIHAYCSDIIRYNANCFSKDCSHAQFCNLINFNVSSKIKNKRKKEKKKEMVLRCNRKQDVVLWQTRKVCLPKSGSDCSVLPVLTAHVCEKSTSVVLGSSHG